MITIFKCLWSVNVLMTCLFATLLYLAFGHLVLTNTQSFCFLILLILNSVLLVAAFKLKQNRKTIAYLALIIVSLPSLCCAILLMKVILYIGL